MWRDCSVWILHVSRKIINRLDGQTNESRSQIRRYQQRMCSTNKCIFPNAEAVAGTMSEGTKLNFRFYICRLTACSHFPLFYFNSEKGEQSNVWDPKDVFGVKAKSRIFATSRTEISGWIAHSIDVWLIYIGSYSVGDRHWIARQICDGLGHRPIGPTDGGHGSLCRLGFTETRALTENRPDSSVAVQFRDSARR